MYGIKQAARRSGVTEELLALWVSTGRVKPSAKYPDIPDLPEGFQPPASSDWLFDDEAIVRIRTLAEKPEKPKREPTAVIRNQEFFTVAEVAVLWNLSSDTIRRWFADEKGVITSGDEHPQGKRRRVTLRIPRDVMERVRRKRAKT
jgi:hypothetical protein